MNNIKFDYNEPFEQICGFGFTNYKYMQNGAFFDLKGMRVNPDTGNPWSEKDEQKIEDVKALEQASEFHPAEEKVASVKVAKVAKAGVKLPKRILDGAK